ncbi:MAG: HNH endonuclease [Flavobacteriia bacterium]|nr:MAG: HNH endonuclease [Flavobacteriia bacterium]
MIEQYIPEEWKDFNLNDCDPELIAYKISNYGRVMIKTKTSTQYRFLEKFVYASGFKMFFYKKKGNKSASFYVHRAVAILFLENKENKKFVIHLNHDLKDNTIINLKWVNRKELVSHQQKNPKRQTKKGYKLSEGRVRIIKKRLANKNNKTRIKMIAKQFGVSTMQIWRIKSGENWSHVKLDDNSK